MSKCQCGRDTLFLDHLGCEPLVCRGCGIHFCPLCENVECERCAKRAELGVSVGDTVIREYEGRPDSREVLEVTMIESGMIFASAPAHMMAVRANVWGLDGGKAKNANSWSQGGGKLRVPEPGEIDAMKREREERAKLDREVTKLVDQFERDSDNYGESYTDTEGLARLTVKYRRALEKIRDADDCPKATTLKVIWWTQGLQEIAADALGIAAPSRDWKIPD